MNPFSLPLPVVRAHNSSWSAISNAPPPIHLMTKLPPVLSAAFLLLPDKAGFGNNFATGDNKSLAQNMEAVVVGCMFKSLITRCASTTHELHSPENLVSVAWNRLSPRLCSVKTSHERHKIRNNVEEIQITFCRGTSCPLAFLLIHVSPHAQYVGRNDKM